MTAGWDRLEGVVRSEDLTGGLQACIADPLWMLAQQRRVGEFLGDDAAEPVAIRLRGRQARLASFRAGTTGPVQDFPVAQPWEAVVEATAEPDHGAAGLHAAARSGYRLVRMLRTHGFESAVDTLRRQYPLRASDDTRAAGSPEAVQLLARWGVDGQAVAAAEDGALGLDSGALAVVTTWRTWLASQAPVGTSWNDERLEYAFSAGVRTPAGEVVLVTPEHDGGPLDWYTCDISTDPAASHGLAAGEGRAITATALPTPVRYNGMPAARWFEFEDGDVDFGDIEAGPADLARLLVAEFATVYGDDWFIVPLRTPAGSLVQLFDVEVVDAFGGRTPVPSVAHADFERVGAQRAWRMFELSGDEVGPGHPAPWLLVPPSLASTVEGPALERVAFSRDEAANLAWGIEKLIEGPLGRSVDRTAVWDVSKGPQAPVAASETWAYRLGGEAPPWWIPFVPERTGDSAQIRLRRARLRGWEQLDEPDLVGPRSELLDPRRPRWLNEEEVPRGGVRVERRWQAARWHDGSLRVWLQRRKRPGRGDRGSGLRWDILDR